MWTERMCYKFEYIKAYVWQCTLNIYQHSTWRVKNRCFLRSMQEDYSTYMRFLVGPKHGGK